MSIAHSFRLRTTFWLDANRPEEASLLDYIADLKAARLFVSTIRDGLRLLRDLRAGNLDVLLALFPWIYDVIYDRAAADIRAEAPAATPDNSAIQQQLARLEKLILAQGAQPVTLPIRPTVQAIEEPAPAIQMKKATSNASLNAINSMLKVQGLAPLEALPARPGNARQMAVPAFTAPTFDDDIRVEIK